MKRILNVILVFVIITWIHALPAHSSEMEPLDENPAGLTLHEAISSALADNPQITSAGARVAAADQRIVQARSGFLPRLYVSETYQRTTNPMWAFGTRLNQGAITNEDFLPERLNDPNAIDNFATQVQMTWPVFDGGAAWFGRQQAGLALDAEKAGLERVRQEIIARTVSAYTNLILAIENTTVVDQAMETARAHHHLIEKRFEKGLAVKSDLLRIDVHIAELEQHRISARSHVAMARAALNAVMGRDLHLAVSPLTSLGTPAGMDGTHPPLSDWIETALAKRPDIQQMVLREQMARAEIQKSKSAHLPSVNLNGAYEINSESFSDTADNYLVGASVTLNLFSGFQHSARARETVHLHEEIKANLAGMKQQVRLETEQAYFDLQSSQQRIIFARTAVAQAEEALRIISDRYESGLLPVVSLLDAELAVYRAKSMRLEALKENMETHARLRLAAGTLDENFGQSWNGGPATHRSAR
ncbi:MAG: TolC family protein [Desulfobacteraceae bacterium]|nr:MAG: TolC family protein [Desulfobacteraceae bacterium]